MNEDKRDTRDYNQKILDAWKAVNDRTGAGASADEVTKELAARGELSPLDTVIDIADLMKQLGGRC